MSYSLLYYCNKVNQCGKVIITLLFSGLNLGDIKQAYQLRQIDVEEPELGGSRQQRL